MRKIKDKTREKVIQKHCYLLHWIYHKKDKYQINSVNPLYLLVHEIDGFIKEKEGSKYLNITLKDSNSKVLKKYAEIWSGIKDQIEQTNGGKSGEYGKDYMKIN